MSYSLEEQESFVHFDPITKKYTFESSYAPHIKNIMNLLESEPDALTIKDIEREKDAVIWIQVEATNAIMFPMPPNRFKHFLPRKKRELTDEQKAVLAQQLAKGRETQASND